MDAHYIPFAQARIILKNLSTFFTIQDIYDMIPTASSVYISHGDGKQTTFDEIPSLEILEYVVPYGDMLILCFDGEKGWSIRATKKKDGWTISFFHHPEYIPSEVNIPTSIQINSYTFEASKVKQIEGHCIDAEANQLIIILQSESRIICKTFRSLPYIYFYLYEPYYGQEPYEPYSKEDLHRLRYEELCSILMSHCWSKAAKY